MTPVYAQEEVRAYQFDTDQLKNQEIKDQLSDVQLMNNGDTWALYVNHKLIQEKKKQDTLSFSFPLENQYDVTLQFNLLLEKADISLTKKSITYVVAKCIITMIDGKEILLYYPDSTSDEYIMYEATISEDIIDFGWIEDTYHIYINKKENKGYIESDGVIQSFHIYPQETIQSIFLETLVPSHPLDMEYLEKGLEMRSFQQAKEQLYSSDAIDQAVQNEMLTLIHERTGLTYEVPLRQFITFWKRISSENYDTTTTETIQTVCQWQENACENVRLKYTDSGRLYAVYGREYIYDVIVPQTDIITVVEDRKEYKNIYWPDDLWENSVSWPQLSDYTIVQAKKRTGQWSSYQLGNEDEWEDCEDAFDCEAKKETLYRYQQATWGSWQPYQTDYPYDCEDNADCTWEKTTLYRKQTATPTGYGSYTAGYPYDCEDNVNCEWKSKTFYKKRTSYKTNNYSSFVTSCSITNDYHCETYYQYSCRNFLKTQTKYSTTSFSVDQQGPCDSGYKITSVKKGYRKRYIGWNAYQDADSCTASVGYTQCQSETRYAENWKKWSDWSDYSYTSCTSNSLTNCSSGKTFYRIRNKIWSDWSDYSTNSCSSGSNKRCEKKEEYYYRYRSWSDWSEWENVSEKLPVSSTLDVYYRKNDGIAVWEENKGGIDFGVSPYYTSEENVTENQWVEKEVQYAKVKTQTLGLLPYMTESQIHQQADLLRNASEIQKQYEQLKSIHGQVLWEQLDKVNEDLYDTEIKNQFLESKIFIPYIYVREHYRAKKQDFPIDSYYHEWNLYQNQQLDTETVYESVELLSVFDPIYKDSKVIYYDYKDPLVNYESLPDNWQGYESLIEEIKRSDLNQYRIRIELTQQDIEDITEYLQEGGYEKLGSCELLHRFSYIFKETDDSMRNWLIQSEKGCSVGSGN